MEDKNITKFISEHIHIMDESAQKKYILDRFPDAETPLNEWKNIYEINGKPLPLYTNGVINQTSMVYICISDECRKLNSIKYAANINGKFKYNCLDCLVRKLVMRNGWATNVKMIISFNPNSNARYRINKTANSNDQADFQVQIYNNRVYINEMQVEHEWEGNVNLDGHIHQRLNITGKFNNPNYSGIKTGRIYGRNLCANLYLTGKCLSIGNVEPDIVPPGTPNYIEKKVATSGTTRIGDMIISEYCSLCFGAMNPEKVQKPVRNSLLETNKMLEMKIKLLEEEVKQLKMQILDLTKS